jgi:rhamnogalacturonan endolyase
MKNLRLILVVIILSHAPTVRANVPGGIVGGTTAPVTVTDNGSTVTVANGIVQIVCTKSGAVLNQINYTYNNGSGTKTKQMLLNGKDGGEFYWEFGGYGSGGTWTYALASDPASNGGSYAEIVLTLLAAGSNQTGDLQVNFSMLRGSPGFYVTLTMKHHSGDIAEGLGEMRTNIYTAPDLNWMSVNNVIQREYGINATFVPAFDSPQEDSLCVSGVNKGLYDDKYKFSAKWGTERVWGLSSISDAANGVTSGQNVGLWYVLASTEYYNGGPLKPELMDAPLVNMLNGGHYYMGTDSNWTQDEQWTRVQGPFFIYLNNVSGTTTDPVQASSALYNDAVAQAAAEATAWPYTWYNNATYDSDYAGTSGRGTVMGKIVINDTYNPNASPANLWVGVVQQPATADSVYDFQQWYKPYQFWVKSDANGNFTIPNVIAGTNYTLYAFGPGAAGTFMSQNQTGGNPPWSFTLPATPFSVAVVGGSNTSLGNVTWTPARVGPTVFDIGYPDRTASKYRHGDDFFVGDIGPTPTTPSPIWTKLFEYPYDFPSGLNYTVGVNEWPTDWNFIQPIAVSTTGGNNSTNGTINFTLPSTPVVGSTAALYLGIASDYYGAIIVTVNNTNLGSTGGVTGRPSSVPASGLIPSYTNSDGSIREQANGAFSDEWISFPASLLHSGSNSINFGLRQIGGSYFADHFMYDYIRLEVPGYKPPAPTSVTGYAGNNQILVSWPTTSGANSYNVLRTVTPGSNYTPIASGTAGALGPQCGSGPVDATYLDTTATNGQTYYYVVQSVNTTGSSGNSPQSVGITPTDSAMTTAPAAPTNLVASGNDRAITVSWTASPGASYYTVQRSTLVDKIPQWTLSPVLTNTSTILSTITVSNTVTGTTFVDNAVTNGTKYAYYVLANNTAGASGSSAPVVGKAAPLALPPAPTVTATPGTRQVTLNWAAVTGAQGYIIDEATNSEGPYTYLSSVDDLTYTQTGLTDNTKYYYNVISMNAGGSTDSATVSVTTPLAPPTGVAIRTGNTQATLTWNAVSGATGYSIGRATVTGGPYTTEGTSPGTSFTNNGLTNGTGYFYVVATTNANGTGANSAEVSGTPSTAVPVAPLGVTATAGVKQVVLNWNASTGATSYTVYSGTSSGGPYTQVASGLTATTYTNTGLADMKTYYYVVAAVSGGGPSANSAQVAATTLSSFTTLLTWDNLGTSPTDPADGSGSWNTTSALWSNGTADAAWSNSGDFAALFGHNNGAAGTVTVGAVTTDELIFNSAGSGSYTLTSGTVTLSGTLSTLIANTDASIGSVLASTGTAAMNGTGTITLTTPAVFTAPLNLTNITLDLNGPSASASMLGTATLNMNGATLAHLTGGSSTSEFSNPINLAPAATGTVIFSSRTQWGNGANPPVTGSGMLNLVIGSNLSGTPDDVYADFSTFTGEVNVIGSVNNAGMRYFLGTNVTGGSGAIWNFGGTGTTMGFYPQTGGNNTVNLGALTGGAAATLYGGSAGMMTYVIGATGSNATFGGNMTGSAGITKVGPGTEILAGQYSYTGPTIVNAGMLEITGTMNNTSGLTVGTGSVFYLAGGALSVSGGIVNNGTFKTSGMPTIASTGSFINNGVLDLIDGTAGLPANFVNNGTVLDSSSVTVSQSSIVGTNFNLSIRSYSLHTYQLQRANSLAQPVTWANVGAAQAGTGSVLNFTDIGGVAGAQRFYRVQVSP